jgi:hypothetical protein
MDEQKNKKHDLESSDGLADFFSDMGDTDEIDGEYDELDQMIDELMALLENMGPMTGGIITFSTMYNYLRQGNYPDLSQNQCFDAIARMRTNHVIVDEITYTDLPDLYVYIFQELTVTEDIKKILKVFATSNTQDIITLKESTLWDGDVLEETLKQLLEKSIVKSDNGIYSVPAFSL